MRWVNQWMYTVFAPPIDKSDKSHVCEPSSKLGTSRDQVVLWIESWWWILNAVNHLSLEMIISPIDVVDYLVDPKAINLYDWGWLYIYIFTTYFTSAISAWGTLTLETLETLDLAAESRKKSGNPQVLWAPITLWFWRWRGQDPAKHPRCRDGHVAVSYSCLTSEKMVV